MSVIYYEITSPSAMRDLGRKLGQLLIATNPLIILMYGDLGCGKTTFTTGLVSALPGQEEAEVSSPSFNLCNMYPTLPPVLHCDLYRQSLPDDLSEALEDPTGLIIIEWAENLPLKNKPEQYLQLNFTLQATHRLVTFQACNLNSDILIKLRN